MIANRNSPEFKLAGFSVGPLQEGNEYELYYWVASELASDGVVHFREEDNLDATKLGKIQWKERIQIAGQISELPEDFYPKLRRYLRDFQREVQRQPIKIQEYERAKSFALDIVNSRLKKIVSLSAGPVQGEQIIRKLTVEEKLVYKKLSKIVNHYRTHILLHDGEK